MEFFIAVFAILATLTLLLHTGVIAYFLYIKHKEEVRADIDEKMIDDGIIPTGVPLENFSPDLSKPLKVKVEGRESDSQTVFEEVEDES